jgi:hypothetical protein
VGVETGACSRQAGMQHQELVGTVRNRQLVVSAECKVERLCAECYSRATIYVCVRTSGSDANNQPCN